jgi:hypothetical protein
MQINNNFNKKNSKKEFKKKIVETKKAYENLYSVENIDNPNINNNKESISNKIKINLNSLELEQID